MTGFSRRLRNLFTGSNDNISKCSFRRRSSRCLPETLETRVLLAGDLDVSFGTAGKVLTDFGTDSDEGAAVVVDASNRILVAGTVLTGAGDTDFALARYTSAGVLDTTFGTGGKVTTSFNTFFQRVYDIAVQSDGKIVVAGSTYGGANYDFGLARYNSNGTLDNTFDDNGLQTVNFGGDDVAHALTIQSDGKIVVVGETLVSGQKEIAIARLNPADGQLDTAFGSVGKVTTAISTGDDFANDVALQGDGKIVIAGTSWNGTSQSALVGRYTTTGALDTTFDENGLQAITALSGNAVLNSVLIQPDGKIVAAGTSSGASDDILLTRVLGTTGAFDTSFNSNGYVVTSLGSGHDRGATILRSSDGSLIVAGTSANAGNDDFAWARYSSSGVLDTSFAKTGFFRQSVGSGNDVAQGAVMLSSGQFLAAGYAADGLGRSDFALVRVNTTNTAPSGVSLSPSSVAENLTSGATVGTLSTTDFDSTTFTYSLVSGTGSTDNSSFTLTGSTIKTSATFDFEAKSSYSIRVRSTDSSGLSFEQVLGISINDVNDPAPAVITSSFEDSGTVLAGATNLMVTFSEPVSFSLGSQQRPAASAQQIKAANPSAADGIYWIDPDGAGAIAPFQVYCDMTTDGGGWMLAVNSVIGAEPASNDIVSNTGTVGLTTAHTRNLNSYFAGTATAEIRHDIDGSNVGQGRFHGKYTADSYQSVFTSVTTLAGHSNSALLQGSFGASFGGNPGGLSWFYNGNPQTTIPASPLIGSPGPFFLQFGLTLNSQRIWIRGGASVTGPSAGGAELASNYELRRAGADGLLGNTDDPIVNISSVTMSGNTATLNFAGLPEDVYRLTVKDTITNAAGNALDGDDNGTAGGNWRKDFVVGALTTSLTSPNGFVFDPEFGGYGAGQLVQGTENAFDGVNRLQIAGAGFAADPSPKVNVSESFANVPQTQIASGFATLSGLSTTITTSGANPVRLSSSFNLYVFGSTNWANVELRFVVDGTPLPVAATILTPQLSSGNPQVIPVVVEDYATLGAGPHIVTIQARQINDPAVGGAPSSFPIIVDDGATASIRAIEFASQPNLSDAGRTISTDNQLMSGLDIHREVTITSTGLRDFAQAIDVYGNQSATDITIPVRMVGNLGSDAATTVFATSDGDLLVEPTDLWFGTDDADGTGTPAIIHLLHGPYGLQPTSVNVIEDNVEWTYNLTVAAGETKRLANFTVLGTTRTEAIAAANALVTTNGFGGEAAAFLTTQELASLANFQFNTAPTDITISSNAIAENAGTNAVLGTLSFSDSNPGDTGVLSLPSGLTNNGLFNIAPDGVTLRANNSFNFEATNAYSVTVRVTDAGGLTFDKVIAVDVTNVNEAPTEIALSASVVAENQPSGTTVGTFSTSDPDAGNTFTYTLVPIPGNSDDTRFTIVGNTLETNASFNFEGQPSYTIRVRSADQNGLFTESDFTIQVTDIEEIPPTVTSTSFLASGTLAANATSLTVTFSESTIGATTASNYELRRAGADGLLGNTDDPIVTISSVTMSGNTATLNFGALPEDVYRLTVKDTITDAAGNALDGDGNGASGGNWRKDFVVGALTTSLTSPNGFVFDPEFGGVGAGQLVQGSQNSWDGNGRLSVNGTIFAPSASIVSHQTYEVNGTAQRASSLGNSASLLTSTAKVMPGLTQSVTLTEAKQVRLSAVVPLVNQFFNSTPGASSDLPVELAFRIDGVVIEFRSYLLRNGTQFLGQVNAVSLEDYVNLSAGTHTVEVVGRDPFNSGFVKYSGAMDGNDWNLPVAVPASNLKVIAFAPYAKSLLDDAGRTIVTTQQAISGIIVSRDVTVPATGSQYFARTIDTFTNSTASLIEVPVRVNGNLGSDAATTVFATSDGDLLVEPTDLWFGTDDADGTGTPAIIHLLHGPFGLQPTSVNVIEDNVEWTYNLTVAAGETKRLASFTVLGTTRAEAIAAANALVTTNGFGGEAAAFLTTDELASLANFQFNTAPTDIALSATSAAENNVVGAVVGTFSSTDPNLADGDTFSYSLVAGTGSEDNSAFIIVGNQLQANSVFDFETKSTYSIRVRSTDAGGLSFERTFTITVTNVEEDVTAPVSSISVLPSSSSSLSIPISVTGSDPGANSSGIKEYDLYYSTGGAFIKFATVLAASPTTTFTGSANTTYWFRSLGRDNAGNVETKTTSDTYTRIGDVVAPATQVTSAVPNSSGLFNVQMTGTKVSGTALTVFDVYVSIDSNAPVLVGSANGVLLGSGNYSGQILFQGVLDGTSHTYRFYSRGRDGAGNVEAAPVSGDVSVTYSFAAAGLAATAIDVQNGLRQRSYVRYLDVLFSSATGVDAMLNAGRVKVERFAIDAASVTPETGVNVPGAVLAQNGNRLRLDFGSTGLGGLRQAGNGFYRILLDMDGNGSFADAGDNAFEFHRLFGDANGDAKVDIADTDLVTSQIGRTGSNLDGDLDGNNAVNSTDRLYTTQQRGKKLLDPLLGWLDD
ncbi:MAG: fibrinogen-like YCDxxxxGGGW domain-containing protein [Planctomycetaceae bacterium]